MALVFLAIVMPILCAIGAGSTLDANDPNQAQLIEDINTVSIIGTITQTSDFGAWDIPGLVWDWPGAYMDLLNSNSELWTGGMHWVRIAMFAPMAAAIVFGLAAAFYQVFQSVT